MISTYQISTVIATCDRAVSLRAALESLFAQNSLPAELIIIDGSDNESTRQLTEQINSRVKGCHFIWQRASEVGAARQRNEGVDLATQPFIWFIDDDVVFETDCAHRLLSALQADKELGGVNAMIVNQRYDPPGTISRLMFTLMHGRREISFAGKVIGPAVNLLPEDRDDLPEVVPMEWLNTTCTMYRREALPSPPFDAFFTGYSLMEDLSLSLLVRQRGWKLANARTARVQHESHASELKNSASMREEMELRNRHYVMTHVLRKRGISDYARLFLWEVFQLGSGVISSRRWTSLPSQVAGKFKALKQIVSSAA